MEIWGKMGDAGALLHITHFSRSIFCNLVKGLANFQVAHAAFLR
jgi:hypothetical protein